MDIMWWYIELGWSVGVVFGMALERVALRLALGRTRG